MYLRHFGLSEYPFSITPDTGFFFSSTSSQEALNTLLIAVRTGEGFIKITGEVGTGKTLVCRKLMASLGDEYCIAYIPNPYLDPTGLFLELAAELGIEREQAPQEQNSLVRDLTARLLALTAEGKRVIVCLDEAQAMPVESLEALRLLTNLETEKRKLLQVIIFGQPELELKLNHPAIRQLRQRITFHYRLGALAGGELAYYLQHRLVVAGHQGGRVFGKAATALLHWRTRRVPRLVNIVAHKALLSAYGRGRRTVGFRDVQAAVRDTASLDQGMPRVRWSVVALGLLAGCAAAWGWVAFT